MAVQSIGRYTFQDTPLAQDALGILYEGVESDSGALVYLKEANPHGRRSIPQSLQVWQAIQQPGLFTAHDEVFVGERHYLITARPPGTLFSHYLHEWRQGGLWGRFRLLSLVIQVCKAVESLHNSGLAHGAIHPDSIVVEHGEGGTHAHLLCFEPFVPHPTSYYLEGNAHVLSLAQEQLRGGGDPRSDVYALGMLLYLGFGAQPPLLDASPYGLAEQVIWGDLAPFVPYLDDLDPALGRAVYPDLETLGTVIIRALRRNPATRYATLKEMRISLEQIGRRLSPIVLGRTLYQNQASDREAFRKTSELAIMILKEAAANPATAAEAHSLQGRIYAFRLGNFDEGVKSFKRAIRQDPSFDSAILGLADTYNKYGRSSLAKEQIEVLVARHPGDIQVLMSYATILYQSGDALSAVNVLHNIQQASPYFLPAYILAIQQSIRQDNLKQAETESARALARILQVIERGNLDPEQVAEVYFLQGLLQHKQGKNELALERLELALKQLPTHQQSHKLLAKLYAERGIRDKFLYHLWASLEATSDAGGMERRPPS